MKKVNGKLRQHEYWEKQINLKYRQIFLQTVTIILVLVSIAINVWLSK
ncbi:MAG: hypothetical protein PHV43_02870 [Candidatus Colwellbacteria bacterium]|nr:hypothetical protein [Candidatus Colwellbacteria bacterium]